MNNSMYPCLWFENQAQAAAEFYCSIFSNSKITSTTPMLVSFELNRQKFIALNAGPQFKFNEAISFVIDCETQAEIDYFWEKLTAGGGSEDQCGWLKDKFGVSWQVIPTILGKLLMDAEKAPKVAPVFMQMKKIDIQTLLNAS